MYRFCGRSRLRSIYAEHFSADTAMIETDSNPAPDSADHGSCGDVHADLIDRAAAWLRKKGCAVVITDMTHGGPETADAIGWKGNYATIVECKASRSDFLADRKKDFRRRPERGMGSLRYFCAPVGLIRPAELPPHWGLLECAKGKLREAVKATHQEANKKEEVGLLLSALRRIAHTAPKGVSVRCYTMTTKCRASLGVVNVQSEGSPPSRLENKQERNGDSLH